jgi:hypothetical protein
VGPHDADGEPSGNCRDPPRKPVVRARANPRRETSRDSASRFPNKSPRLACLHDRTFVLPPTTGDENRVREELPRGRRAILKRRPSGLTAGRLPTTGSSLIPPSRRFPRQSHKGDTDPIRGRGDWSTFRGRLRHHVMFWAESIRRVWARCGLSPCQMGCSIHVGCALCRTAARLAAQKGLVTCCDL